MLQKLEWSTCTDDPSGFSVPLGVELAFMPCSQGKHHWNVPILSHKDLKGDLVFCLKQTFHHLSPTSFTAYTMKLSSEGGKGHLLKNVFQPQSSAHVTLCSPPFLVMPKFSNKSSVYSLHISSTKALFSFYIKITGEGQLHVQLKTTERQENNNRTTQRTVVDSFTALYFLAFLIHR